MAHLYTLTGMELTDPTHLYIETDDDNLVSELRQPDYRAADLILKSLVFAWEEYVPTNSPEVKDIEQFKEFIVATYGTQTYTVRQQW
jgi:hypothetical protein